MKMLEITYDEYMNAVSKLKDYAVSSTDNDSEENNLKFFDYMENLHICKLNKERDN